MAGVTTAGGGVVRLCKCSKAMVLARECALQAFVAVLTAMFVFVAI